jgi:hypothetical protein
LVDRDAVERPDLTQSCAVQSPDLPRASPAPDIRHDHPAIRRLAHVVNRKKADLQGSGRFYYFTP